MMSATKRNSSSSTTTTSSLKVCCFCNSAENNELEYGKLYDQDGIVTHYYCLLLSSNMEQKGNDDEGILGFLTDDIYKELRRGKRLVCSYCKKIGATLGCCNVKCKRIFHFPCGLKAGSLHQFFGQFKSFCINHRPKQKIDEYVLKQINPSNDILCYICYDRVNPQDFMETLWAPCCKKDAWFHRKCVQQLALSAGYFFKCPLCNNKKDFQNAMLQHGIYIPSQDASWELVPNAFEELLYRHDQCDATMCLCPKGRKHTSSNAKWELVLCRICGSQGIHMACGKLKWANPVWECDECTSILRNAKERSSPRSGDSSDSSSLSRDSDSDESDSDISVGTDFPILCSLPNPSPSSTLVDTSFKSRPGPRSFKLQQQLKACGMVDSMVDTLPVSEPTSTLAIKSTTNKASKENNSAQKSKMDDSQQTNKENDCEQKKLLDNDVKSRSNPSENVIITIESDDDDDVEIIALKRKINIPTVQIAWANIFHPLKSDDSNNSAENSAEKNTKEVDPLQTETQSCLNKALKNCDNTIESNISKSTASNRRKITTSEQPDVTVPPEFTRESTQEPTFKSTQVAIPSNNDDLEVSEDASSIMNIKITNVTSLPPEVFASVPDVIPDVNLDEDIMWLQSDTDGDSSSAVIKPLEKWVVPQQSSSTTMKRGIHDEVNNTVGNNCKRIKGNISDKTLTDIVVHDTRWEQSRKAESKDTPNVVPNETNEVIKNTAECTAVSITKISTPSTSTSQKNDILGQTGTDKVDTVYAVIESNHHPKKSNSAPKMALPQNSESDSVKLYAPVVQSGNQIYYSVPSSNIFYTQPISSLQSFGSENTAALYATTSSDVIRQPVIQNTSMISKCQSVIKAKSTSPDVIVTNNSQEAKGSSNQQAELLKEKTVDDSSTGNDSSRIVCDGDAGRTNPAVTPRPACFSEAAENAGTADTLEITGREVEQRRVSQRFVGSRKTYEQRPHENDTIHIMSIVSHIRSIRAQCSVFPRVTNNHNTCHQPRLIPQYMHLHDLKFRICGKNNIQMILYDTFSVNISTKNTAKDNKIKPSIATWESRAFTSQVRCEASSSSSHADDGLLVSRFNDDKTECIGDMMAIVAHDDAKENLDPVSRTVSRNVISSNISVMNGADDTDVINDTWQHEYDVQTCLVPSDTNSNALGRAICNTSIDNIGKDEDRDQSSRVDHRENVQSKQFTSTTGESGWLPCRRTIHNIDSDLNIVRMSRNVQKVLQNNVIVTANQRVDDKRSDGSRATDDSPTSRSHNLSFTTGNHRKSGSHAHLDRMSVMKLRARDRNTASDRSVPNIIFNESNISNKQIDACDSSQIIRCVTFREDRNRYNGDPAVRVSIDLHKIQNLIDSKPELFVSDEDDDDDDDNDDDGGNGRHRRCIRRLRDEDDYTQQQARFRDSENNDNTKYSSLRNNELQALDRADIEKIEVRDSLYASANTLNRYRKRERENRSFDRRNR